MVDELSGRLALCLAHGLEDTGLGHTPKIVVDRRRPPRRRDVDIDGLGDAVGVSESARTAIPGLVHGVDAEPDAMREQRVAAVSVTGKQRVPQVSRLPWQLLGPTSMPVVDGLRNGGVVEAGRLAAEDDALHVDLQAGVGRVTVEELEAERMEQCQQ